MHSSRPLRIQRKQAELSLWDEMTEGRVAHECYAAQSKARGEGKPCQNEKKGPRAQEWHETAREKAAFPEENDHVYVSIICLPLASSSQMVLLLLS